MLTNVLIYSSYPIIRVAFSIFLKKNYVNFNIKFLDSLNIESINDLNYFFDILIFELKNDFELDDLLNKLFFINENIRVIFLTDNVTLNELNNYKNFTFLDKLCNENELLMCLNEFLQNKDSCSNLSKIVKVKTSLSKREIECANLLMKGYSTNQISKKLSLALTTVSTYKMRILKKTKTNNIIELTKSLYNLESLSKV